MNKPGVFIWKLLFIIVILFGVSWGTWCLGRFFTWDWSDFWSNLISNAASSAVIGFVLYWVITRPDEKKATNQRRAQALSLLKGEFKTNLLRAKTYREALKTPENDLMPFYPLRFTRGAWNALRESGFLPQLENVSFVYELLRVNEVITVANSSLASVRSAKASENSSIKLTHYAQKALNECEQIEKYLDQLLEEFDKLVLPEIAIHDYPGDDNSLEETDVSNDGDV